MSNNRDYELSIKGKTVQNVGLRKELHKILDDKGVDGVAVNYPEESLVRAYLSGPQTKRNQAYKILSSRMKEKTGNPITITEKPFTKGLKEVRLSKQQLEDVSNAQYLAYMMATGKKHEASNSLGLQKAEEDLMPRFRLQKKNNEYYGRLPEMGVNQITGKAAHYEKFLKKNRQADEKKAYSNMIASDAGQVKKSIDRLGRGFLDQ